ncbi:hypothetical protein BKA93DRAFT_455284 [Sparassis latifolia]
MHINDSKGDLKSNKDRHENIGLYVFVRRFVQPHLRCFRLSRRRCNHMQGISVLDDLRAHPDGPAHAEPSADPRDACIRRPRHRKRHGRLEERSGGTQ